MRNRIDDLVDKLFGRHHSLRPGVLSRTVLERMLGMALRMMREFHHLPALGAKQKQAIGGYLFWEGHTLVEEVARGLRQFRDRFPELHVDPDEMEEGLRRAGFFNSLRQFALQLYRFADDMAGVEVATQVRTALAVMRHVRADRQRLFPGPRDADRAEAMRAAEETLAYYHRRSLSKK